LNNEIITTIKSGRSFLTPRKIRSIREFAEQEITIPNGPFKDLKFKINRQPFIKLYFDQVESGNWSRFMVVGCVQSGKTLGCYIIPACWFLFELDEDIILGLPSGEMATVKWKADLEPVIKKTRYSSLLPQTGSGSRGGKFTEAKFGNERMVLFLTGGGGDAKRSGATSRAVFVTELDKMDQAGNQSRETDKVKQIEARTKAFGNRAVTFGECTASIETGRIWVEYKNGTESKIVCPCPNCGKFVTPEREHLAGWKDAETELDAMDLARFHCPGCATPLDDDQRRKMNESARLIHRGQTITKTGKIRGKAPRTRTLGFRWNAFNNLLWTTADIAGMEWTAARDPDDESSEREILQFVWAKPYRPKIEDVTRLDSNDLQRRTNALPRGMVPADSQILTCGIDVNKWGGSYVLISWANGRGFVVEYGIIEFDYQTFGTEKGIDVGLTDFWERIVQGRGWTHQGQPEPIRPDGIFIDSGGTWTDTIYDFCRDKPLFMPVKGYGTNVYSDGTTRPYSERTTLTRLVLNVGERYHLQYASAKRIKYVQVDADHWKTWIHERLSTPPGENGSLVLYDAPRAEHFTFSKHLTAEKQVKKFIPGRGDVMTWETVRSNNHYFDATYLAAVCGHFKGFRLEKKSKPLNQGGHNGNQGKPGVQNLTDYFKG